MLNSRVNGHFIYALFANDVKCIVLLYNFIMLKNNVISVAQNGQTEMAPIIEMIR